MMSPGQWAIGGSGTMVSPVHLLPGLALERVPRWRMPTDADLACVCLHPGILGLGEVGLG